MEISWGKIYFQMLKLLSDFPFPAAIEEKPVEDRHLLRYKDRNMCICRNGVYIFMHIHKQKYREMEKKAMRVMPHHCHQ